jgi:starch synthase
LPGTPPLKICLATAEFDPLAKTGGLADVCAALSVFFRDNGHEVRVLMPRYSPLDASSAEIVPVEHLQDLSLRFGPREIVYSIDTITLPRSSLPVYLLRCDEFYDRDTIYTTDADEHLRFTLLSRAAIEMCQRSGFAPDIFHCHDWHAALIPLFLKSIYAWDRLFSATRSVLTIHNIGYQGIFDAAVLGDLGLDLAAHDLHQEDLAQGRINFLKTGLLHADLLTTVSPTYAGEIQGEEQGMGMQDILRDRRESLVGILNGVDYAEWNPETDPLIPRNYSRGNLRGKQACKRELMQETGLTIDVSVPLIGMVTRLASQKGIDLIRTTMPGLLGERDFTLVVLGSGEPQYEQFFDELQGSFPGRVSFHRGYNNGLAHRIEAGSDLFLMPSHYEPCGLNQMYSLRYGTVPIVRRTGGLADSVDHYDPGTKSGDGVVFDDYTDAGLRGAMETALDLYEDKAAWKHIVQNGMARNFSWEQQGARYVELFRRLIQP